LHPDSVLVPKLLIREFPQFWLGLGNVSPTDGWGYDCGFCTLDYGQWDSIGTVKSASFAAVAIPREIWEGVGPLDARAFFMYYEDVDWCFRAFLKGVVLRVVHSSKVWHHHAVGPLESMSLQKARWVIRSRWIFSIRHLATGKLLAALRCFPRQDLHLLSSVGSRRWGRAWAHLLLVYFSLMSALPKSLFLRLNTLLQVWRQQKSRAPFFVPSVPDTNGTPELSRETLLGYYFPEFKKVIQQ